MKARFISFKHAMAGLKSFFSKEVNAWIHLTASLFSALLGIYLQLNSIEWILLSLTIAMVFFTEIINTAIERLSDFVMPDHDHRIKEIKDLSAASVLVTSIIALIVGIFLFLPKLLAL